MKYQVEALARGPEGAVRLQVMFGETHPTADDVADVKANVSGSFRSAYGTWPKASPRAKVLQQGDDGKWVDGDTKPLGTALDKGVTQAASSASRS